MHIYVKAITGGDEWELEVLGNPYYGPAGGKDRQGEYFSPVTKFHEDRFGLPPVVYYHGMGKDKRPAGTPEYIGKTVSFQDKPDGRWYRVILNKASAYARRVWDAAQKGMAVASSGSAPHLVRKASDGHILEWPNIELSLWDGSPANPQANGYAIARPVLKALYDIVPEGELEAEPEGADSAGNAASGDGTGDPVKQDVNKQPLGVKADMEPEKIAEMIAAAIAAQKEKDKAEADAQAQRAQEVKAAVEDAIKAARVEWDKEHAADRRLGEGGVYLDGKAPAQTAFADTKKYDGLDLVDQALLVALTNGSLKYNEESHDEKYKPLDMRNVEPAALKAFMAKAAEDTSERGEQVRSSIKAFGIDPADALDAVKANELNSTGQAGYGAEFIGTAYSNQMWEVIRLGAPVAATLPSVEIPQGYNTLTLPLEGSDPTFYKVGEATDLNGTTGLPDATVGSSKIGTSNKSLTVAKMGARMVWSGEMEEDTLIPHLPELRRKLQVVGAEYFESAIIDGDTATGATTNINHIGGTPVSTGTAQDYYLLFNGLRKLALVTNTANSRAASSALSSDDFLQTVMLMGNAGINGLDMDQVMFAIDPNVNWKLLRLPEFRTRDVSGNPTLEGGRLSQIWGYKALVTTGMAYKSANRLTNSAGKVDQTTTANNLYGQIMAYRKDQVKIGYKRRQSIEVQRIPGADASQIVLYVRFGFIVRDNEASAITYAVNV